MKRFKPISTKEAKAAAIEDMNNDKTTFSSYLRQQSLILNQPELTVRVKSW